MSAVVVALLVTGASLLVAEAHVASYGVLGVAGVLAIAGALAIALGGSGVSVALAVALAVILAVVCGAGAVAGTRMLRRAGRRRALGGASGLVGRVGVVRRAFTPVGIVFVMGELWHARPSWTEGEAAPAEGEDVVVEDVRGLTLWVRRAEEWEVDL
jgi:membrane-bound serine protease (ClpP class)